MASVGTISGLASGIQWRDMIDQIIAIDRSRQVTPIAERLTAQQTAKDGWTSLQAVFARLQTASAALRDGTAFGGMSAAVTTSGGTGRAVVSASAGAGANRGSYKVEVLDLARSAKLGGDVVGSATTALNVSGEFVINGRRVSLAATDTLNGVRDKINAVNAGTNASGVTASVLSTGSGQFRLILSSTASGAAGIDLIDGDTSPLQQLGVVDSTRTANVRPDGAVQSARFAAVNTALATMLGVTSPAPSTVVIGGRTVSVDLTVDSLSAISARIQAAGGAASVEADPAGGPNAQRLVVSGGVSASTPDGQRTLELLGFVRAGHGAIAQSLTTEQSFTDASNAPATGATLLTDLQAGGAPAGLQVGDTFNIRGARADGSAVSVDFTVGAADTMQSLLDRLNDATTGFGAGATPATAVLQNGQIVLADQAGGDSQLAMSLTATSSTGNTLSLGRVQTSTVGRLREMVAGTDARLKVDGVLVTNSSNTLTSALPGVSLNLLAAEPGTVADVVVSQDVDAAVSSVKAFVTAYNAAQGEVTAQRAPGAALAGSGAARSAASSLTSAMLTDVFGAGSYSRATLLGVSLNRSGVLEVDDAALRTALSTNLADVKLLFGSNSSATDPNVSFVTAGASVPAGSYGVTIAQAATRASITGAAFSGVYADDGTADSLTITDSVLGTSATIALNNGDTITDIVSRLNTEFSSQKLSMTAANVGGQVQLQSIGYGSTGGFSVAYAGGGTDGSAQLGLAAGTYTGLDVMGSYSSTDANGLTTTIAATGRGQRLTADAGTAAAGLVADYLGSAVGSAGTLSYSLGLGGMMARAADGSARTGDGVFQLQIDSLDQSTTGLEQRISDAETRLLSRQDALVRQFTAMEAAMSRMQAQSAWLSQQIAALNGSTSSQ